MSELPRVIGVRPLTLNMMSVTIGAGIFGLPALAAQNMGAAAILGYLVCVVVLGVVGLCIAEAGSRVSGAGGLYAYAGAGLGPTAASVTGILLLIADGAVPNAAVAVLLVNTLAVLIPELEIWGMRTALLAVFYLAMVVVNVRGVKYGVVLSQVLTVIKLLPLIALVLLGIPYINTANLQWHGLPNLRVLGQTTVLLYFAFMGFESALNVSGEVKQPERTVPRALLLALTLIATLYVGLQLTAQGILGDGLATAGASPLGETAGAIFGSVGMQIILWATVLSTAGLLAADAIGSPRAVFAVARDGLLPRMFAQVHRERQTPANAIIAYHVVCFALAATGSFNYLVIFGAAGVLAMYLICCLSLLRLRSKGIRGEMPPFVAKGGAAVPIFAAVLLVTLLATLKRTELVAVAGLIVFAVMLKGVTANSVTAKKRER